MTDARRLAACIQTICDPETAGNFEAWHELHKAGFTRESMKAVVDAGAWMGPAPVFAKAPPYDGEAWLLMNGRSA